MDIIVCIKQVPDAADVKIDPKTNTLIREGVKAMINPFDMYAIEESIRLKEKHGGKVTVITMGPPQAEEALREAISLGADEAILVSDRAFAGSDTWATSYTLAKAVEKIGQYDGSTSLCFDKLSIRPEQVERIEGLTINPV
ncbi:MAG: electron transfer flavoprotein subunit beta/FixA family protein, partial [Candidatus Omnitrophica bacterium]|nr:electron transfer flavoprotein subunit beta/FixA family protein [Candidatus Omnitrophota bacterium]